MVGSILLGALVGLVFLKAADAPVGGHVAVPVSRAQSIVSLTVFGLLLVALPLAAGGSQMLNVADSFFRAGSLVFGGGHVVLPLLEAEVVAPGWVTADTFLAGYGAAQAVPGPLFTFAAYLGAALGPEPNGLAGAALALAFVFLPGFLILVAVLPWWDRFRAMAKARSLMQGANAAVVGILAAALYSPVFTGAVKGLPDFALALGCFVALVAWKAPPWLTVAAAAVGGAALSLGG
jgi:chromate transporter